MNSKIKDLILEISLEEDKISIDRKIELDAIASIINKHLVEAHSLDIVVVCTHNSRRSQLGEAWINTLAHTFGIKSIKAFSGGMEVTAFNERMVFAVIESGFKLHVVEQRTNPRYVLDGIEMDDHLMYSKVYDDPVNPKSDFMAFMVCDHADENCPVVHGMKYRIPLRYKDPKEFDNTDQEQEAYLSKVKEIGREIYYLLNKVKQTF